MIKEPLLTVLLLTYNQKKTFEKSIESILAQKTNFDFVIYVLDDCSTDGTSDLVKEYAKKFPDVVTPFIRESNLGFMNNHYLGLCSVHTEYFTTLEGDDYWCDENKLQIQVDALNSNMDCVMCAHNSVVHHYNGKEALMINTKGTEQKYSLIDAPYLHTSSRVHRNIIDFLAEAPDFIAVDIFLFYEFLSKGKVIYINKPMSVYNITGEGVWSSLSEKEKQDANAMAFLRLDLRYNRQYTSFFAPKYLAETNKNIFKISFPISKTRKISFEINKIKVNK